MCSWKVAKLFIFLNGTLFPYVRRHHEMEDKVYVPWIASRVAVPEHLKSDHMVSQQASRTWCVVACSPIRSLDGSRWRS
jgi:hypothetical protein